MKRTLSLIVGLTLMAPAALAQDPGKAQGAGKGHDAPPAAPAPEAPAAEASPAEPSEGQTAEPPPSSPTVDLEAPSDLPPLPGAAPVQPEPEPTTEPEPTAEAKPSVLPPPEGPRLLVMDLVDYGAGEEVTNTINQAVQNQATKSHAGEVVSAEQLRIVLDANSLQQMVGCDTENCMATLGQRVDARIVLGGNVSQVGADYLITVTAVDPSTGKLIRTEQRKVAAFKDLYFYAARQLTALVLTGKTVDPTVPVMVNTNVPGAELQVDGRVIGEAPTTVRLDPGSHEIVVKAEDFVPWKLNVEVEDGTPLSVEATLIEQGGFPLWPVAILTGGTSVLFGVLGAAGSLHAYERHSGGPLPYISWLGPGFQAVGMPPPDFINHNYKTPGQDTASLGYQTQIILMIALAADIAWGFAIFFGVVTAGLLVTDATLWLLEE